MFVYLSAEVLNCNGQMSQGRFRPPVPALRISWLQQIPCPFHDSALRSAASGRGGKFVAAGSGLARVINRSQREVTNMTPAISPVTRAVLAALVVAHFATGCNRADEPVAASPAPAEASKSDAHERHAAPRSHDAHAGNGTAPVLAEGQRWATDEPLRAAMTRIRHAVERIDRQHLQAVDAATIAIAVEQDIAYMIANCRLEPEPDAALHALIGRMMNATEALRKDPMSDAGMPQLTAVLHEYQATFDHPGWTAPGEAH